ncbi:hypothetical protein P3X46_026859 [Hevea brasiliensis]|uniref:Uncharacterized protein n=1 Tax=Hevea brasiliensis TaxID=3981 RepID=A0ABQ9KY99_HEVBR|nr:hypothetical protein P3X46_026859 [Hevea brasiliensis]
MAGFSLHVLISKQSLVLSLKWSANFGQWHEPSRSSSVRIYPPTCRRKDCPSYDVTEVGDGYEICSYSSCVWMPTSPVQDVFIAQAIRTDFLLIIMEKKKRKEMTGQVITEILPSDGPFCEPSFTVNFYVPKENPPSAEGLHVQRWNRAIQWISYRFKCWRGSCCLAGTVWAAAIEESRGADATSAYTVEHYNSPFEFDHRINGTWILFDIDDELTI